MQYLNIVMILTFASCLLCEGCSFSASEPKTASSNATVNYQGVENIKTFYQLSKPSGYEIGMPISDGGPFYSLDAAYKGMQEKALEYNANAVLIQKCIRLQFGGYECSGFLLK